MERFNSDQKPSMLLVWWPSRTHSSCEWLTAPCLNPSPRQLSVRFQFVGADSRAVFDVLDNMRLQSGAANIFDDARQYVSVALDHAKNNDFVRAPRPRLPPLRFPPIIVSSISTCWPSPPI